MKAITAQPQVAQEVYKSVQDEAGSSTSVGPAVALPAPSPPPLLPPAGPIAGPVAGPLASVADDDNASSTSQSDPYLSEQALIMNLTLPPVPNFDIPDSPPGSPDPAATAKLEQFAKLKRQGVHFNERLASSTSIKNPNLFKKLMDSFEISEKDQYATTLPLSIWDPSAFPAWAYKDELAKAQAKAQKQREPKKVVEFAPAADSADSASRAGQQPGRYR